MLNPIAYLREVNIELRKVTWPTRSATVNMTLLVLCVSAVISIFLGLTNYAIHEMMTRLITVV